MKKTHEKRKEENRGETIDDAVFDRYEIHSNRRSSFFYYDHWTDTD